MKIIFIIYTCVKRIKQAEILYALLHGKIKAHPIILCGNPRKQINSLQEPKEQVSIQLKQNKYMEVDMYDGYEGLNKKTMQMCRGLKIFFPSFSCIKCDDDIVPNITHINELIDYIQTHRPVYAGKPWIHKAGYSIFHYNKNIHPDYKKKVKIPIECHYCPGPMYYIDPKAIEMINNHVEDNFFEDVMVGLTLNKHNIYPDPNIIFYTDEYEEYKTFSFHNNNHKIKSFTHPPFETLLSEPTKK